MKVTGGFCPQCGMPALHYSELSSCIRGWFVLVADCQSCDYGAIRGFRRAGGIPDENGIVSAMFARPLNLDDLED